MAEITEHERNVSEFYSRIADWDHDWNEGFLTFGLWKSKSGDAIQPPLCYPALYKELLRGSFIQKDHSVLEVACGQGAGMLWINDHFGCQVQGLDVSVGNVEMAKRRLRDSGLSVTLGSATKMPYKESTFDFVICVEGMPHFKTREGFFQEAFRVLKPGGKLLMADIVVVQPVESLDFLPWLILSTAIKLWVIAPENASYGMESYSDKMKIYGFQKTSIEQLGERVFPDYCNHNLTWSVMRKQAKVRGAMAGHLWGPLIDGFLKMAYQFGLIEYIFAKAEKPRSSTQM